MIELKTWLEELSLGKYAQAFLANEVDFDVLPDLTELDLEHLGVSLGDRKRLLRAITALSPSLLHAEALRHLPASTPRAAQGERRQVTVMFCDLVGSTEMSARLDPEDLRQVLRAYQRVCAETIVRYDGFIAQYLGDGILAYFGYPYTHEDEAERAVRGGLAVLKSIGEMGELPTGEFQVRIGIATGPAVIGDLIGHGSISQIAITGKTPNLAARIQQVATPGTLVIAASTRRLVVRKFKCTTLGTHQLKGIGEDLQLWQVLRELSDAEQFEAKRAERIECIGRNRELGLLLDRWQLATEGSGQAVVVSGEAGIGKSRLASALREQLRTEALIRIRLQCAEQYRNSPLQPVINHLRRAADIAVDDLVNAKLDKIQKLVAREGGREDVPLIASLLSVPLGSRYPPLIMSPLRQRVRTLEVLIGQLLGLSAKTPVLLEVEDAHWLDPTTEETLINLLDRLQNQKLMMLVTTRPEYSSRLVDHPRSMTVVLGRLGPNDTRQMISTVAGVELLPPEIVESILLKTDGVPLFIEELTKDLIESGLLNPHEAMSGLDAAPLPVSIPSTLQDTLRARLDRLSAVKDVAQIAAAIGRSFAYGIVAAVLRQDDDALRAALNRLVESKLIYQHGVPPEAIYAFKHALVQDVAYEGLLRSQRIALHTRIVEVIETQFPLIAESEPEVVAYHCFRAELGEKALTYWLKAGTDAVSRSANVEAISHLRNALQCLRAVASDDKRTSLELELQLILGQALIAVRGYTAGETTLAFARAEQLVEKIGDVRQRYAALYGIFVGHLIAGRINMATETIGRMYELASTDVDSAYSCLAYRLRGSLSFFRGDLPAAESELQRSVSLYGPEQQKRLAFHFGPDTGSAAQIFLAMTEWLRGKPTSSARSARSAITIARQLENALTLGQVLTLAAQLHYMSQDFEGMLRLSKEGSESCERIGVRYFGAICNLYQIWALAWNSARADHIEEFQRSLALYAEMGSELQLGLFDVMLAQLFLRSQRPAEAARQAEAAIEKINANGERWWAPEIHRTLGNALLALPIPGEKEAENCFRHAVAEARHTGARMLELRAATSLGQIFLRRGDQANARLTVEPLFSQFGEETDSHDFRDARDLLATVTCPPRDIG